MTPLVYSDTPVTLVGGAPFEPEILEQAVGYAPTLIGADRGGGHAAALGYQVTHVIGDMDSGAAVPGATLHHLPDQDTTDFEKCLDYVDAPFFLAIGFTGRRMDHTLATFQALLTRANKPVLVLAETDLIFLAPLDLRLILPIGSRVSLYPLAPVQANSAGLRWPLEGLDLGPHGKNSVSNESSATEVRITLNQRNALIILPRENLDAVILQLFGQR